jgi:hypothetical protein
MTRHRWPKDGKHVDADNSPSLCDQTERVCIKCGLTRITVHPPVGYPYTAWRRQGSARQFPDDQTPPCEA